MFGSEEWAKEIAEFGAYLAGCHVSIYKQRGGRLIFHNGTPSSKRSSLCKFYDCMILKRLLDACLHNVHVELTADYLIEWQEGVELIHRQYFDCISNIDMSKFMKVLSNIYSFEELRAVFNITAHDFANYRELSI